MDHNSSKNQEIKRKFVEREVYCCVSGMVEYILSKGYEDREAPFTMDDVENIYINNSEEIEELNDKKEELEEQKEKFESELEELEWQEDSVPAFDEKMGKLEEQILKLEEQISNIEDEIEELENEQEEPQEVYEWWMCSGWLIDKLANHNEPVLKDEGIWGRTCTGQAILLDGVISRICEELEILEGQRNEWKL
jgi:DNA repair exonuclease SbcCD ATPase subunit